MKQWSLRAFDAGQGEITAESPSAAEAQPCFHRRRQASRSHSLPVLLGFVTSFFPSLPDLLALFLVRIKCGIPQPRGREASILHFAPQLTVRQELRAGRNDQSAPFHQLSPLSARGYVRGSEITWPSRDARLVLRARGSFHRTISFGMNGI